MIGGDGGDDSIYLRLIGHSATIDRLQSRVGTRQPQMMKTTRKPQGHGILQRQAGPVGDASPHGSVALHQYDLCINDPSSHRRAIAPAMLRLPAYAICDPGIIH
jgi:hypothetical protein